ncbi:MAG: hypothetical protein JO069_09010 [Verrucomicrobia bacterium]|nr:hypothetical protein [Verrucomicrobiota bacterium]
MSTSDLTAQPLEPNSQAAPPPGDDVDADFAKQLTVIASRAVKTLRRYTGSTDTFPIFSRVKN